MSNFIYNDNLNGSNGDNREPIQFYFGREKAKRNVNTTTLIIACVICVLVSSILGILGGMLVSRFTEKDPVANEVIINDIQRSPYETYSGNGAVANESSSRIQVIAGIKDTVVEVRTEYAVSHSLYTKSGAGSGVIIGKYRTESKETGRVLDQGYYIVTNAHVIADAINSSKSQITVTLTNGTDYEAYVVGSDITGDIAVLKISEDKELQCAVLANENYKLQVGEDIIAIGNPLGQLGGTVTNGYVSALDRKIEIDGIDMNLLQIDAPVNPGNSGGGLFNLRGELVGIVNAKSIGTEIEGLGFAIPINDAHKIYTEFLSLSYVTDRPTLFIEYDTKYNGVYVTKLLERPSGDNSASLKVGDQILGVIVNGETLPVDSTSTLDNIIAGLDIGTTVDLWIRRGAQSGTVTVSVYEFYI